MTEAREAELMAHIPTLGCGGEVLGFTVHLKSHGEALTARLMAALQDQADRVRDRAVRT
jgi:hypothetical protein